MVSKDNSVAQVLWNWGVFFFGFCNVFFCIHRVIYLADLTSGFITKKIPKFTLFFLWKYIIVLKGFCWTCKFSEAGMKEQVTICIWKNLFGLLYPTWTNFSEKIFSNDFLSCFEWKYWAVSQNVIFMSLYIYPFSIASF